MNFAFSTNAFRNFSLEESIRSLSSIGYSAVELMCDIPHAFPPISDSKIKSIKNVLQETSMQICNLNGFMLCAIQDFHHPSWIEKDQRKRKQRIEHTKNCIELARVLGVNSVSTEPGGPPTNISEKVELDTFACGLNDVIPFAEKNRVKLLIEPEPGLLIENSKQFLNFITRFDTKYLGLNFDIGHFFCVREKPEKLIKTLQDYISHIHLEDIAQSRMHKHLIPGMGAINFRKIFDAINDINYKGYITIELYPYQRNPKSAAKKALDFVNSLDSQ